jgi:hypothetical protein
VGAFITLAWFVPHTSPAELHTLVQLDAFNASIKADEMEARKHRLMEAQIKFFERENGLRETKKVAAS